MYIGIAMPYMVKDLSTDGSDRGGNIIRIYSKTETDTAIGSGGGGSPDVLQTVAATGATQTIDVNTANYWDITLTADDVTLTLTPKSSGNLSTFTLVVRQDGTGSREITWPASVDWAGGIEPTLSTGGGDVDIFSFLSTDGGTTWFGVLSGNDFQ